MKELKILLEMIKTGLLRALLKLRQDPDSLKRIYLISLGMAVLVLAMCIKGEPRRGELITNKSGFVTSIRRASTKQAEEYELSLKVGSGKGASTKNYVINLSAEAGSKNSQKTDQDKPSIDVLISNMLQELEASRGGIVELPGELSDGTKIFWSAAPRSQAVKLIVFACIYIFLVIAVMIDSSKKSKRENEKLCNDVLMSLPGFTNQLLMMMSCGVILSDALRRICSNYRLVKGDKMNLFESKIEAALRENQRLASPATILSELARGSQVKEFSRIATILLESEHRGTNVLDNLSRESSYLWENRVIIAKERGKAIDTKMAYPLGMLLILLIVITMAPALLSM